MDEHTAAGTAGAGAGTDLRPVTGALRRLGSLARAALVTQRAAGLLAILLGLLVLVGALDYALRFPQWMRVFHWCVGLAVVSLLVWRHLLPAVRFHPSATQIALRVERGRPELRGLLASGVELAERGDASAQAGAGGRAAPVGAFMRDHVVHEVSDRWSRGAGRSPVRGVLRLDRVGRALLWLLAAAAAAGAIAAVRPRLAAISAERTLAPWTAAEWPKRTALADVTDVTVHPLGASLPLRAALLRSAWATGETDVAARFRTIRGDVAGPTTRVLLTWQNREIPVASAGREDAGALFERLVEADGDFVEYRFETVDDQTPWKRVRLVPPPAVLGAKATITPPAYASSLPAERGADAPGFAVDSRDLGPGRDERAVAPRSLAGSDVEMTLTLNKPLPASPGASEWVSAVLGKDAVKAGVRVTAPAGGTEWTLRWTLNDSMRLPIALVDEYGIPSVDESVFRFEAEQDHPPSATVTAPESDRTVLATAVVDVTGEGRDDVGLAGVWLERQKAQPAGAPGREKSGPGGAIEPVGDRVEIARVEGGSRRAAQATAKIDLSTLGLRPGDELWLTAVAQDIFADAGVARAPVRSAARRLRIISEADFVQEMRNELSGVRQAAIRIDEQQGQTRDRAMRWGADAQSRRSQAQVTERLARQDEAVQRLTERTRQNGLVDRQLEELLNQASALIQEAGKSSGEASRQLDEAASRAGSKQGEEQPEAGDKASKGGAQPEGGQNDAQGRDQRGTKGSDSKPGGEGGQQGKSGQQGQEGRQSQQGQQGQQGQSGQQGQHSPQGEQQGGEEKPERDAQQPEEGGERPMAPEEAQKIDEAQRAVQENLENLIALLDRGEDTWVTRRSLEEALREQRELREQTAQAGAKTAGRSPEELGAKERSELDRIVQKQGELAEKVRDTTKQMQERAEKIRQKDPAAAAGMSEAARRAERSQTAGKMQQAAKQAQQNQMASAGQQQEQAIQDLEEMLKDMDRAERAKEEALRRVLASLVESLDGLIRRQGDELSALELGERTTRFDGLDLAMMRLNQNTLGVLDLAKGAGREVAPVADLIGRASEAQTRAIVVLRKDPVDAPKAREGEQASLDLLKQAKAEAERIDRELQQKQQRQQRRELRRAYKDLLEKQVALRADTAPFAQAKELSRRDRAAVRGLAEREIAISDALREMVKQTRELTDARVFEYAHKRLDRVTADAARSLGDGDAAPALPSEDSAVTLLQGLVEALKETPQREGDFQKGAQGGGQSGSGKPKLIPELAELRLLRQIQVDVATRTRDADGGGVVPPETLEELGQQQRDLNTIGEDLIKRMSKPDQGPPPTGGVQ